MRKKITCFFLQAFFISTLIFSSVDAFTQMINEQKIKLFVDCSNSYCDMSYIKTQIKFVDYVLDNKVSDIHLLITQQNNGGGGSQYQLIFFGQNRFHQTDTLRFNTNPNNTSFEDRELLVKYIQLGLIPYVGKTRSIENLNITLKEIAIDSAGKSNLTTDQWNYWVFKIGLNGNVNSDANYNSLNYNLNSSASRITDKFKVSFNLSLGKRKEKYNYTDSTGTTKTIVKKDNYNFSHQLVKSISEHWSVGYNIGLLRSTYNNYKFRSFIRPAIEYNIYPYKDVNNKLFTIRYGVDIANNRYFDTTLYFKTHETLTGQQLDASLTYNQKWGTVNLFSSYHSYLSNLKLYNLNLGGGVNVRISGGLSFNVFLFGSILRDQIYLPNEHASFQDILLRLKQLKTNFTIFSFFGISYRFGSKLNNFINPRFNEGGGNFFFSD